MKLNERLALSVYLRHSAKTIDGAIWVALLAFALICLIGVFTQWQLIPLRQAKNAASAIVLLLFSPLITFLVMISLRQLPFAGLSWMVWFRAVSLIVVFLIFNF